MSGLVWLVPDGRTRTLPTKVLASHREPRWEWRVLNRRGQMIDVLGNAELDEDRNLIRYGVTGGSLEMSTAPNVTTRGSGEVQWAGQVADMPAWDKIRLQPVYHATFPNGETVEWPFGVYLPAVPRVRYSDTHASASVALYDKTLILRNDALGDDLALPAGADPVANAFDQVVGALNPMFTPWEQAEKPIFEETAERLRTPMFWQIGTSVLRMVNDALGAAGWFGVWADGNGTIRSSPYVEPSARPVVWDFTDLPAESIYLPDFEVTDDWFDAPNRVIAIASGDGEEPGLLAEAANLDEDDPLSYWGRGRWVTRTEENVEATSQAVLDAYAQRLLRGGRAPRTVQLQHAPIPLEGNARVSFSRAPAGLALPGVVTSWNIDCTDTGLMTTTIQEIVT